MGGDSHGVDAGIQTLDEGRFGGESGYGDVIGDGVGGVGGRDGDTGLGGHDGGFLVVRIGGGEGTGMKAKSPENDEGRVTLQLPSRERGVPRPKTYSTTPPAPRQPPSTPAMHGIDLSCSIKCPASIFLMEI